MASRYPRLLNCAALAEWSRTEARLEVAMTKQRVVAAQNGVAVLPPETEPGMEETSLYRFRCLMCGCIWSSNHWEGKYRYCYECPEGCNAETMQRRGYKVRPRDAQTDSR